MIRMGRVDRQSRRAAGRRQHGSAPTRSPSSRSTPTTRRWRRGAGRRPGAPRWALLAGRPGRRPALIAVRCVQTTQQAPLLATERAELIARISTAEAGAGPAARPGGLRWTPTSPGCAPPRSAATRWRPRCSWPRSTGSASRSAPSPSPGRGWWSWSTTPPGAENDRGPGPRPRPADPGQRAVGGRGRGGRDQRAPAVRPDRDPRRRRGDHRGLPSLTRPYRVEAIGDPRTLPATFVADQRREPGGTSWPVTVA